MRSVSKMQRTASVLAQALSFLSTANHLVVEGRKPNILLIMADDVGTEDLPIYWKDWAKITNTSKMQMPNLQYLSSMGVLFQDAHSSPLCAPSRYMLLSGNYPPVYKRSEKYCQGSAIGGIRNRYVWQMAFGWQSSAKWCHNWI